MCKPAAVEAAVLGDGRVLYFNGLESQENAGARALTSLAPSSRDSQARLLDLRSGTPAVRSHPFHRGAHANPNVEPGHTSYDDPLGAVGVPGRPGDGFVGSDVGQLGGPPQRPDLAARRQAANDERARSAPTSPSWPTGGS